MSDEYVTLREEIERMGSSYVAYAAAVDRYAEVVNEQVAGLWADNAALRDELHAVANRLENLTRARLTEPAEVAERMIFTCRLNPGCNVSSPHIHDDDGAVIFVQDEATADDQLRQRSFMRVIHRGDKEPS